MLLAKGSAVNIYLSNEMLMSIYIKDHVVDEKMKVKKDVFLIIFTNGCRSRNKRRFFKCSKWFECLIITYLVRNIQAVAEILANSCKCKSPAILKSEIKDIIMET